MGITRKVTPHTLHHFFATRFLQKNGGDIATLAKHPGSRQHQHDHSLPVSECIARAGDGGGDVRPGEPLRDGSQMPGGNDRYSTACTCCWWSAPEV